MAEETEVLGENMPHATLSTTDPTLPNLGSNPGRRGGRSPTIRLSYGTTSLILHCDLLCDTNLRRDSLHLTQRSKIQRLYWCLVCCYFVIVVLMAHKYDNISNNFIHYNNLSLYSCLTLIRDKVLSLLETLELKFWITQ
jgi:hypothetical protein